MPNYRHTRTGNVVFFADGSKLISIWEPVEELEAPTPAPLIPEAVASIVPRPLPSNLLTEIQTFETVIELKKSADKESLAKTIRGAVYKYSDGEWRKTEG